VIEAGVRTGADHGERVDQQGHNRLPIRMKSGSAQALPARRYRPVDRVDAKGPISANSILFPSLTFMRATAAFRRFAASRHVSVK
jgi:hypothetical protein